MRSTLASVSCEKSNPPPMSLAGIPSMRTFVKFDSPPRRKSDVGAAALTDLDDLRRRDQAQCLEHVELVDRLEGRLVDHRDRRAGPRLELLRRSRRDHDVLLERTDLERNLEDDAATLTDENCLARLRLKAGHAGLHLIAVWREAVK